MSLYSLVASRSRNEGEIAALQKSMESMHDESVDASTIETLNRLKSDRSDLNGKIHDMIARDAGAKERIRALNGRVASITAEMARDPRPVMAWNASDDEELAKARQDIEKCTVKSDALSGIKTGFKKVLSGIRESIMATINPEIMAYIKKLGKGDSAIKGFEIVPRSKTIKNDVHYYYDFKASVNDVEMSFNSLSTGQRALAIISIILNVINMSRCSLSLIIFDEIDNCGLDKDYITSILKAIVNISSEWKIVFIDRNQETIDALVSIGAGKNMHIPINVMRPASRSSTQQVLIEK